ncbi:unnamed protein product [Toxocara canis]|nr:unnamed protein product [Toxocara canis]
MPHGCQATFHGGDRCCCSQNKCNFDRILAERRNFRRFLPKTERVDDVPQKAATSCGKRPGS